MPDSDRLVLFRRAPPGLDRAALEQFARELCRRVTASREFRCLITNDGELRRLNRQFLAKDYPTDVLSFPAAQSTGELGQLAISGQRASVQARDLGHSVEEEICILMLHGVLHLRGMDHERDRGAMARAEAAWRKRLGLACGLIERLSV